MHSDMIYLLYLVKYDGRVEQSDKEVADDSTKVRMRRLRMSMQFRTSQF